MIPGYGGGTAPFDKLAAELRFQGIETDVIDVGDGTDDLDGYADEMIDEARQMIRNGEAPPDLIGYSAGGLTARIAWTERPELFRKVITIGTPHAGTGTADLGAAIGDCPEACQQMRPDSPFLADLPEPSDPAWLSIWSDSDEVIRPPDSSELADVTNYRLQEVCDGDVSHGLIVANPQTIAVVEAFLADEALPESCVTS